MSVALGVGVVFASVAGIGIAAGVGATAGAGASTPAPGPRVSLPQAVPHIPADATQLGPAPSGQVLKIDVALAGQDPATLAQAVAAVSTPGSPDYRHYVTPAQFTASYGPLPAEVDQVTSALRSDGLDVGDLQPDSNLLPVTGTRVGCGGGLRDVARDRAGARSGPRRRQHLGPRRPGLAVGRRQRGGRAQRRVRRALHAQALTRCGGVPAGLFAGHLGLLEHRPLLDPRAPGPPGSTTEAPEQGQAGEEPHAQTPQACAAAQDTSTSGIYTSTEMSDIFGLNQLFAQGRTGIGKTIAVVEFEQYLGERRPGLPVLLRTVQPHPQRGGGRPDRRFALGQRRGGARCRAGRLQRSRVVARRLRGAQQQRRGRHRPVPEDRQ